MGDGLMQTFLKSTFCSIATRTPGYAASMKKSWKQYSVAWIALLTP